MKRSASLINSLSGRDDDDELARRCITLNSIFRLTPNSGPAALGSKGKMVKPTDSEDGKTSIDIRLPHNTPPLRSNALSVSTHQSFLSLSFKLQHSFGRFSYLAFLISHLGGFEKTLFALLALVVCPGRRLLLSGRLCPLRWRRCILFFSLRAWMRRGRKRQRAKGKGGARAGFWFFCFYFISACWFFLQEEDISLGDGFCIAWMEAEGEWR